MAEPPPSGGAGRAFARFVGLVGRTLWRISRAFARLAGGEVVRRVGGPARARVVFMFGAVLALSGADTATVGAVAPQLEHAFKISDTEIGLLSSVALLAGAVFTIPVGVLVDRSRRMPILAVSIVFWSLASLFSAFAGSYSTLLLTRLALGAVTATAGPAIASLTGDYFPANERGRIYAYILAGEVAGSAVGYIISGSIASLIDWRAAFVLLALPGFWLARGLWQTVPEPLRGGQSHLAVGAVDFDQAFAPGSDSSADQAVGTSAGEAPGPAAPGLPDPEADAATRAAQEAAQRAGAAPNPKLLLREDPREMPLMRAVRYILRIPSNLMMIIGSSLGYFYFSGLQTFALLFVEGHYRVGVGSATLVLALLVAGALIGTLISGRLTDVMLRNGMLEARVWFPAGCYIGAAALLVPGFLSSTLTPAVWFDVAGAALLSAANPPLQAARLDVVPAGLWGRAESTRTFIRSLAQAIAPTLFGGVADLIAGFVPHQAPIGTHPHAPTSAHATGLEVTFLIMLVTLVAAGVFVARAHRTYAVDVATAAASTHPEAPTVVMATAPGQPAG